MSKSAINVKFWVCIAMCIFSMLIVHNTVDEYKIFSAIVAASWFIAAMCFWFVDSQI